MTGTPVQNSLDDLRSLIQFLRVPHLDDTTVFQRHIAGKQRQGRGIQRPKPDYENLKMLLGSICLRRSISSLSLSLGFTCLENCPHFSEVERRAYNDLAMSCKRSIDAVVSNRQAPQGNRAILTALLRLRIFCNTGLIDMRVTEKDSIEQFNPDEINSLYQQSGEAVCVECGSDILSFDINDGLDQQLANPYRRLKCPECVPQIIPSHDGGYSLPGHLSPAHNVGRQHRLSPKEDSGYECGFNSHSSVSDPSTYPSKLKALLSDILEHQSQEKR
jgi:SWI/SNF-related matrix-associated actin-dependent regulator of chromatin subfamily A3